MEKSFVQKSVRTFIIIVLALTAVFPLVLSGCRDNNMKNKTAIQPIDNEYIVYYGRVYLDTAGFAEIANTASGFEVLFEGSKLTADLGEENTGDGNTFFSVFVDGELYNVVELSGRKELEIFSSEEVAQHKIKVLKNTEAQHTLLKLYGLNGNKGKFSPITKQEKLKMAFYGDSITAGYGNIGKSEGYHTWEQNGLKTYATMTADALNADVDICAYSGWAIDKADWHTTPMRIPEIFKFYSTWRKEVFLPENAQDDIVVVNLGTNDYTYYKSHISERNVLWEKYIAFYRDLRLSYPRAQIIFAYGMMNWDNLVSTVNTAINKVIDAATEDGDTAVHKLKLHTAVTAEDLGAYGHPSVHAHNIAAEELTQYIQKNVLT